MAKTMLKKRAKRPKVAVTSESEDSDGSTTAEHNLSSVAELFTNDEGCTFLNTSAKERNLMLNFTMKKHSNVIREDEAYCSSAKGKWLFELSFINDKKNDYFKRMVALDSSCFLSRVSFHLRIQEECPNLFIMVKPIVNATVLSKYLDWLQEEYLLIEPRSLVEAPYLGFYKPNTWVLSNKLQIKDGRLVPEIERTFVITDEYLRGCRLQLETSLLNPSCLKIFMEKFLNYSVCFGVNQIAFLQTVAFGAQRLFKSADASTADEARYCSLYSKWKSVGKTTTLAIIAKGIGVEDVHNHKFVIGGGDGFMSGMTLRLQQHIFSVTNLLVVVNEMSMTKGNADSLVQSHERFGAGSMTSGYYVSRASILGSTNSSEHERLEGRMVNVTFRNSDFGDELQKTLMELLIPLVDKNKGFLIAWCSQYIELFNLLEKNFKSKIQTIIKKYMKDAQRRLHSALSSNMLSYILMHVTAKVKTDILDIFLQAVFPDNDSICFIRKFSKALLELLRESKEKLTWINPKCSFTDTEGKHHEALAIRISKFKKFSDIAITTVVDFIKQYGKNAKQVNVRFSKENDGQIEDLSQKDKIKKAKAHKFPWSIFSSETVKLIKTELGMVVEDGQTTSDSDETAISMQDEGLLVEIQQDILVLCNTILTEDNDGEVQLPDHFAQCLKPLDRLIYLDLPIDKRETFKQGFEASTCVECKRRAEENVDQVEMNVDRGAEENADQVEMNVDDENEDEDQR